MSTNITRFKVHGIELMFPLTFDFQHWLELQPDSAGKKWCLDDNDEVQANLARHSWKLPLSGHQLSGMISDGDDRLEAIDIDCRGEGSARIYEDILIPLFEDFKGSLRAVVVWEDGTVYRLTIDEGEVEETEIN